MKHRISSKIHTKVPTKPGREISGAGGTPVTLLRNLTLDDVDAFEGVAWSANIIGKTNDSVVTAVSSDSTVLTVTDDVVSGTFAAAGTPNVTLTETLGSAANSPKSDNVIAISVTVAPAVAPGQITLVGDSPQATTTPSFTIGWPMGNGDERDVAAGYRLVILASNNNFASSVTYVNYTLTSGDIANIMASNPITIPTLVTLSEGTWKLHGHLVNGSLTGIDSDDAVIEIYTSAPSIGGMSPNDDAVDVAVDGDLVISFNRNVEFGASVSIAIYKASDDSLFQSWDEFDNPDGIYIIGGTLTIHPVSDFENDETYYVQISSGSIQDLAGNAFGGIVDTTTWNFTTEAVGPGGTPASYTSTDAQGFNPAYGGTNPQVASVNFVGTQIGYATLMSFYVDTYDSRQILGVVIKVPGGDVTMSKVGDSGSNLTTWMSDQVPSGTYDVEVTLTFTPNFWSFTAGYVATTNSTPTATGSKAASDHADPQVLDSAITIPTDGVGVVFCRIGNGIDNIEVWTPTGTAEIQHLFTADSNILMTAVSTTPGSWQPTVSGTEGDNGIGYSASQMNAFAFGP